MRSSKKNEGRDDEELALLDVFGWRLRAAVLAVSDIEDGGAENVLHQWLADQLGYSSAGVRRWFVGEAIPSPAMLKQLCYLLEVSLDHLFDIDFATTPLPADIARIRCIGVRRGARAGLLGAKPEHLIALPPLLTPARGDRLLAGCWLVRAWSDGEDGAWLTGDWVVIDTNPAAVSEARTALVVTCKGRVMFRTVSMMIQSSSIEFGTLSGRYSETFDADSVTFGPEWPITVPARGVRVLGVVSGTFRRSVGP
jgi:hypothetical protein